MREINKSFWDFLTITGATTIAIPLMIFSESIQARYLGPQNYGKTSLVLSAISIIYLFGLNWLNLAILRFGKEEFIKYGHLRQSSTTFLVVNMFNFLIVTSLFYNFRQPIFKFLEIKHEFAYFIIISGVLLNVLKNYIFGVLKVIRLIKIQAILFRIGKKMFISLGMLFFVFKIISISVNYIIAIFLVADFLIIVIGFSFIKLKFLFPLSFNYGLMRKILIFCFPLLFSSWSSYIVTWVDTYVIKYFMTLEDVGYYQASYKIFTTLKSFLSAGIVTIFTPIIINFKVNKQYGKIKNEYMKRVIPQISFFSMILISLILIFSDIAFEFIYGNKFSSSITPFKILITSLNFSIIARSYMPVISTFDMTKMILYAGLITGVINLLGDILIVPVLGIVGAAMVSFVVFMINPICFIYYVNRKFAVKRNLSLMYPVITIFILIISLYINNIILRFVLSSMILGMSFILSRRYNLLTEKDINMTKKIKMPNFVRSIYIKIIKLNNRIKI